MAQSAHKELHRVNFAPSPLPSVHTSSHHEVSDWGSVSAWEVQEWKEKSRDSVKQIKENEVISPWMTDHCVCPTAADKLEILKENWHTCNNAGPRHTHTHTHIGLFYNVLSEFLVQSALSLSLFLSFFSSASVSPRGLFVICRTGGEILAAN